MNGVAALRSVLTADAAMLLLVPSERIVAGDLTMDTALPAVTVQSISAVDMNIPSPAAERFVRERVQATVHATSYEQQKEVLAAVKKAAADVLYPVVEGITGVTIHTDGQGPDFFSEDASVYLGSMDFMIKYSEER